MATKSPADKYAFLFSGPTGERPLKDLENVAEILIDYYNYPTANVRVVLGSTPVALPSFSGATTATVTSVTGLATELANLATVAAGAGKTVLLYFTGWGVRESGASKLVTDDNATSPTTVDSAWLTTRLNAFGASQVNLVMQQSYAGGFDAALTGSTLSDWTFTYACEAAEESYGDSPVVMGSYFTHAWTRGLKLEVLPALTPHVGQYADELGGGGEATNRLISLEEAMTFGKEIHDYDPSYLAGTLSTPGYAAPAGGTPQHLGLPDLLIRDGSPWYESPDITLTHPNHPGVDANPANQDLYIADSASATPPYNNTVNVAVRNMGTHPVRDYAMAMELFWTGGGGAGSDQYGTCNIVPSGGVLFPMMPAAIDSFTDDKKHTFTQNIPFVETSTHRCLKAGAELLCADLDHTWTVTAADNEAQRNIDLMPLAPSKKPFPAPSPTIDIQGLKEHVYALKNTFNGTRRFLLVLPEDYFQYGRILDLKWFQVPQGPLAERVALDIVEEPVPHIPLLLQAGAQANVLFSVRLRPQQALEGEIRLPVEIMVEGPWEAAAETVRAAAMAKRLPNFAAFAGFTVIIGQATATLKGTVLDRDHRPAAGAKILLRTVNDLQGAVLTADKTGAFAFEDINPDVYHLRAETEGWHAVQQTVVLTDGRVEEMTVALTEPTGVAGHRVKVIVDKIRIMNDKDPCIKGKGELMFTSVVVPDHDHSRKKVTHLPETGVYHVGDKPGRNEIILGFPLFEGVVRNRHLSITLSGKEIDLFDPDDELTRYHRVFSGDPATWYGEYYPGDEYLDREDVKEWAIWYRIIRG